MPRAAKNSWSFERFMLLQKVNNLSYQIGSDKIYLIIVFFDLPVVTKKDRKIYAQFRNFLIKYGYY